MTVSLADQPSIEGLSEKYSDPGKSGGCRKSVAPLREVRPKPWSRARDAGEEIAMDTAQVFPTDLLRSDRLCASHADTGSPAIADFY
jgi:hypothetical protein